MRGHARHRWLALVVCAHVTLAPQATATVAPALSLPQLVVASDLVVVGTPIEAVSEWRDGRIVTKTTLLIDRVVHTTAQQTPMQITLITAGGVIGDLGLWVPGEAVFDQGKTYFVFAHDTGDDHVPVGMAQGSLQVVVDSDATSWVLPPVTGSLVEVVDGQMQSAQPFLVTPMALDGLEGLVSMLGAQGPC